MQRLTDRRMSVLLALYGVWMAVASVLYFMRPAVCSATAVCLVGIGSAAAVVIGVRLYRPRRAPSWFALAGAVVLNAAARLVADALPGESGTLRPGIWIVWLLHLAMLVLLIAGTLGLARSAVRGATAAIDTTIIALGAGLLLVVLIAIPYATEPDIGTIMPTVRVAYVVRDVFLVAVVVHLATAVRWTTSVGLLVAGSLGLVTYDALYRLGRIRGEWLGGTYIDAGWLLFFIAIGAAALVPSMVTFDHPSLVNGHHHAQGQDPRVRLGVVGTAALMPSAVLLIGSFEAPPWFEPVTVLTATAILILALIRVLDVASQLRHQVRNERVVREATAELADAHDPATVTTVLDHAVGRLLNPITDYRVAVAQLHTTPVVGPDELRDTGTLPPALASRLGNRGTTLAVPLHQPAVFGDRQLLFVRSSRAALEALRPRLAVLATQAGSALERMRLNEEIIRHTSEAYFRTLVHNSADVILIIDDANRIRYASPSARSVFGASPLHGVPLTRLLTPEDGGAAVRMLDRARAETEGRPFPAGPLPPDAGRDWTVISADGGATTEVEASCRDLRADPSIEGLVLTLRNVTEQRELERELARRAFHDPLTGLTNRLPFSERLEAAVRSAAETGALAGVLFVDLDDLKMVNDGFGHEAGDAILSRVGQRLGEFVAEPGTAGLTMASRLGGDEFAILIDGARDEAAVDAAANRLTERLMRPMRIGDNEVTCAASVGVATTAHAGNAEDLLRNADIALYAAKGSGKRQWRRFEPWMRTTLIARLELRAALERAIEEDEFFLEYQPVVALDGGRVVGFEALLRWQHPTRGRLPPEQFIDVAEESGLIAAIGEWVFETGFKTARTWGGNRAGEQPYIAVNVSARQFRSPGFLAVFRRLMAESGLRPDRVMVEITESLLLREDDSVWTDLRQLRRFGVAIAIDDFGTGYSALSYLRQVPLDVIKLDRSFIRSTSTSLKQRELVRGIVGLANTLDLQVVAEGIETRAECLAAAQAGCDYGQGFLFSPPIPAAAIPDWLATQPTPSPAIAPPRTPTHPPMIEASFKSP